MKRCSQILIAAFLLTAVIVGCKSTGEGRAQRYEREQEVRNELQYGKLVALEILKRYPRLKDEKATLYVNKVGKSVAMYAGRHDFEYHFAILDTPHINAYAAPGGYVFITRGALVAMENESQLAAVLAHEIAHVNLKHILNELPPPRETQTATDRIASVLAAQGTLVSAGMRQVVEQATKMLFEKGLKKEHELAADETALFYTAETGYRALSLPNYLKKIQKASGKVYDVHPPMTERLSAIDSVISRESFASDRPLAMKRFKKSISHLRSKGV